MLFRGREKGSEPRFGGGTLAATKGCRHLWQQEQGMHIHTLYTKIRDEYWNEAHVMAAGQLLWRTGTTYGAVH